MKNDFYFNSRYFILSLFSFSLCLFSLLFQFRIFAFGAKPNFTLGVGLSAMIDITGQSSWWRHCPTKTASAVSSLLWSTKPREHFIPTVRRIIVDKTKVENEKQQLLQTNIVF